MELVIVPKGDQSAPRRRPGPKPDPTRTKSVAINIRVKPGWKAWLESLAAFDRSASFGDLIDKATVAYARQIGFTELPPER